MNGYIVIFSAHYLPHVGGVEVFTDGLARALIHRGFRVAVVTNRFGDEPRRENIGKGLEVVRLPNWSLVGGRLPMSRPGHEQKELLHYLDGLDVRGVIVNTRFYPHSLIGARFAQEHGLTPVVIDHGADYLTFGNAALDVAVKAYEHAVTALIKRRNPAFYGISEASSRWLRKFGIESRGVISNAIDAEGFRSSSSGRSFRGELGLREDVLLVTYSGRMIPEKGVDAIVGAAALLATRRDDVAFVLAGDGPLLAALSGSKPPCVHFAGRLSAADVSALMGESDVFCFPSRSEGFGSALLEAAVCGNALVSTDVGIASRLIGEGGGVLVAEPTPEVLAKAIGEFADDREHLAQTQRFERQRSESLFTWDECVNSALGAMGLAKAQELDDSL